MKKFQKVTTPMAKKLGQIEIQAEAAVQQPDRQVVDDKPHGGNAQKNGGTVP